MADKRMFNKKVIESDEFLLLSHGAQVLYFHLCLNSDDEGFLNNAKTVMAITECHKEDLEDLISRGFVIQASPTVYCIAHWFQNNQIRSDRFHPSMFTDAKRNLVREDGMWKYRDIFNDKYEEL